MLQDLRHSLRALTRTPGFTIAAVLSLAVGIGANAAMFSLVDLLLLRPLPVSDPESLVFVTDQRSAQQRHPSFSYPFYALLRESPVLEGLVARYKLGLNAEINGHPARISAELVSGNYFSVVGASTQLGRPLTPADDRTPGSHPVIVVSESLWRREFGGDASVLGRTVPINNYPFTIVGVAARDFAGTDIGQPTEVWLPMMMQAQVGRDLLDDGRTNWLGMIGRLRSGMNGDRAAAELTAYVERRKDALPSRVPGALTPRLVLIPGGKGSSAARTELGPALRLLMAMTALALVLACVNVANLLLVRAAAREKEVAVRLALGARRMVLARQVFVETLLLAALGGAAGVVLAPWAAGLFVRSRSLPLEPTIDARVFLFGLAVSTLTGALVGLAPILSSRKIGLQQVWGTAARNSAVLGRPSLRDLMVVCQIAVSLAMLIGAALLVQSFRGLSSIEPGFRADNLLLIALDPASAGYNVHRIEGFWRDTLERVKRVAGVQTVSLARIVPLAPSRQRQRVLDEKTGEFLELDTNFVGPDYFRTLGVPLLRGREFADDDRRTSRLVVIVNEEMARRFWPGDQAVGKYVRIKTGEGLDHEVVGVVKDVKYRDLRGDVGPMLYRPVLQTRSTDSMTLHVRVADDPEALVGAIRRELQILDPNVPLFQITTLEAELNGSFAQTRQAALLMSGFGMLALILSALGIYSVTALAVSRQTRNIGIRMALGAEARHIIRVVTRRGMSIVATGLVLGLVASYGFAQLAQALLFGVTAADGLTFAGMSGLLIVVCLIAIYIPARAATRLDPVAAIRYE